LNMVSLGANTLIIIGLRLIRTLTALLYTYNRSVVCRGTELAESIEGSGEWEVSFIRNSKLAKTHYYGIWGNVVSSPTRFWLGALVRKTF